MFQNVNVFQNREAKGQANTGGIDRYRQVHLHDNAKLFQRHHMFQNANVFQNTAEGAADTGGMDRCQQVHLHTGM